jgi:hypothetical protein
MEDGGRKGPPPRGFLRADKKPCPECWRFGYVTSGRPERTDKAKAGQSHLKAILAEGRVSEQADQA